MKRRAPNRQGGTRAANAGFALIDCIAAAFAIAVLSAIGVYYVNAARIKAASSACRNNLRQIGAALGQYADVHHMLPAVTLAGPGFQVAESPFAQLLPHLALGKNVPYDSRRAWFEQAAGAGSATILVFHCPASSHRDPIDSGPARITECPMGSLLGTTDYIVCKGDNDSWCMEGGASALPPKDRGVFEIGHPVRYGDIADGLAQTIVVGEGTGGSRWLLGVRGANGRPNLRLVDGHPVEAINYWAWPFLNSLTDSARMQLLGTSIFGTTAVSMNEHIVAETVVNPTRNHDCRSWRQAIGIEERTGNSVSGFRSDHPVGSFFLFADGSCRFLSDDIENEPYEALSTIAGGESVQYVD